MQTIKTVLNTKEITNDQIERSHVLKTFNIKGFTLDIDGNVTVLSVNPLSEQEQSDIVDALKNPANPYIAERQDKIDFSKHPFFKATPQQVDAYIDNNVNDLPSAKSALKVLAKAVTYLLRRSDLSR